MVKTNKPQPTARGLKLDVTVDGKPVYLNKTGLKVGSKGKVERRGIAYSKMSKNEIHRVLKAITRATETV